ncbi:hypothetical protein C8J57DRAFT_1328207 [Mycena rebaudengoi]|nr:hypothetical protein C8J57DRAFT_1328207 [Mycena rebaudengoi]
MTPPPTFRLDGDVAIVSGAGSRKSAQGGMGNGRAAAILLARQGAKVALLDHIIEQAQETKRMIDEEGGISEVIHCDATVEADCKNAVKKTVELFGAVHILVNVVGIGGGKGTAVEVDIETLERDFRTNVISIVLMSRYAIPEMRKAGRGSIVNIASLAGLLGGNPGVSYPATKGAVVNLTRGMAAHHGTENIRVNCVAPGLVYTPMVSAKGMSDEVRQARMGRNLLKQEGTGWDVGAAILFLSSREARWITGVILPVDGGTYAGNSASSSWRNLPAAAPAAQPAAAETTDSSTTGKA